MSMESGSVSCRIFYVPRPLPADAIERFAAQALPALETLKDGTIHGWVTGRHALDRNITADTATLGGYLRLSLMHAELKVPEQLLRAECKMEELATMQAQGLERRSSSQRREIRRTVEDRLRAHAQPTLKGIHLVYDARRELIYTTAISARQCDALQIAFTQAMGFSLIPATPEMAAMKIAKVNVRDWNPASFSTEAVESVVTNHPGMDFLTWLWFRAEAHGGMLKLDIGDVAFMLESPLEFRGEGMAQRVAMKDGEPLVSASAKAALVSGMKPSRAKITLAQADKSWTFTLDAESFAFRGLKLPEGEKLDAISRFQDRMDRLDEFQQIFFALFKLFVAGRSFMHLSGNPMLSDMQAWVANRKVRG